MRELTIFFDGSCPLCAREMQHLKRLDLQQRIELVDLSLPESPRWVQQYHPDINLLQADRILHGKNACGRIITGLDVTHLAWSLVGRGHWTAPLRWPLVRPLADRMYLLFARHRRRISALLSGQFRLAFSRCLRCSG